MKPKALDVFAGPGGWDLAASYLGFEVLGLENDPDVGKTRAAAGLRTELVDVAAADPASFDVDQHVALLIGSPPCPTWSSAAGREGVADAPKVATVLRGLLKGRDLRSEIPVGDPRTMLVVEPFRYALTLQPRWIALEQVPAALEVWRFMGDLFRHLGYRGVWAGLLNAADFGVPQMRERAFLIADALEPVHPPHPTHGPPAEALDLFGGRKPYVTMAAALGWGMTERPYPTIASGRTSGGGPDKEKVGGSEARAALYREQAEGRWVYERPSTTVQGDPRVWAPGHKENAADPPGKYQQRRGDQAIRVELEEAAVLQGFPRRYPFHGTKTSRFRQVGNAVPPPLALAVLSELTKGGVAHALLEDRAG